MIFDPSYPVINEADFESESWKDNVYGEGSEEVPPNVSNSMGYGSMIHAYIDSDHAGYGITRRSRSRYIIFLNNAPVYWTSKK